MMRRYIKHALIAIISVLLLALIVLQLAVGGGIIWLRSGSGQDFVKNHLETALKDSPYQVRLSGFSYSFPQGLTINDLEILDHEGRIASTDRLTLRPALLPLALKRASLSAHFDTLTLYRLPEGGEEVETEEKRSAWLEPFTLPDLFFNQFVLSDLHIQTFDIREGVNGTAMQFSPSLWARVDLRSGIDLDLNWQARNIENMPEAIPEDLRLSATLNPQNLDAVLDELVAQSPLYRIEAKGAMNAGGKGAANFSALLSLPILSNQGLDDIEIMAVLNDAATAQNGRIEITSAYNDMPLKLTSDVERQKNLILINPIDGSAPDLSLSGEVSFDQETSLVTGAVKANIANLKTYSTLAGVDLGGNGEIELSLMNNEGIQGATVKINANGLAYEDISAAQIKLDTTLPDISAIYPSSLDLTGSDIVIGTAMRIPSATASLSDKGEDRYGLLLDMKAQAQGENIALKGGATLAGLQSKSYAARDIDLGITVRDQRIKISGAADLQKLDLKASANNLPLSILPSDLPPALENAALDVTVNLNGTPASPIIKADLKTSNPIRPMEGVDLGFNASGNYANGQAKASMDITGDQIQRFDADLSMPMNLSLYPYALDLNDNTPLSGAMNADADLEELSLLFLTPDQNLSGDLNANANISGTLGTPLINGNVRINDGAYRHESIGAALRDITLDAAFTSSSFRLNTLSAHDGEGGTLEGSGEMSFGGGSTITIRTQNMHLFKGDQADGYVTSELLFDGQGNEYALSGTINLDDFNIQIPEQFHSSIPQLNIVEKETESGTTVEAANVINLDIKVKAENRIFVRGWGLDAEFGGALDIGGDLSQPLINGNFSSIRGRYEEFGKRFDLQRAALRFQGSVPPSPYLDIVAVTNTGDIEASINLSGRFQKPKLALSSVPSLPQDEILSRILFGKDMSKITPFQAIQLKNTLDRFTGKGGGGFDPASMLRNATGLDDLRVDTDDEGQASVGVGKYLTDNVYLELEKGAGETSGAAKIQVEVTPNINVETEVGQDAQAGGGVFWKYDY